MTGPIKVLENETAVVTAAQSTSSILQAQGSLKRLLSGATVVFVGTMIWQMSNFAFNAVGAHSLGPAKYGALAASMALLSFASPLLAAVQTVTSRETTSFLVRKELGRIRPTLRHYARRIVIGSLVLAGTVALASNWISKLFRLGSPWLVVLVGVMIPGYIVGHMLGGLLQGVERFASFAGETVVEGLAKAAVGILFMDFLYRSALGGMAAVGASCVAGLITYLLLTMPRLAKGKLGKTSSTGTSPATSSSPTSHRRNPRRGVPGVVGYSMMALSTYGLLTLMLSSDMLVAKHYLPNVQAGLYAGVSLTGKIAYFAASSVFVVAFPIFSRHDENGIGCKKWVLAASVIVCATAGMIVALFAMEPAWVVVPLLGDRYTSAEAFVPWMAAVFGLYALGYLMSLYLLAQKRRSVIAVLAAAVLVQFFGYFSFHTTLRQFIGVLFVSFGVMVVGDAIIVLFPSKKVPERPADQPSDRGQQDRPVGRVSAPFFVPSPRDARHDRIVNEITRVVGTAPILLCGSRALGTAHSESDYDISVVLPLRRIPRAITLLAQASRKLSNDFGIGISLNAFPEFRIAKPAGSLFAAKLSAEGVVLAAPTGWSLRRRPLTSVTDFAACSALLSAARTLLEAFDPSCMQSRAVSDRCGAALRKAALHVAQVRLLRSGSYESRLDEALTSLRALPVSTSGETSGPELAANLIAGLSVPDQVNGFLLLRECILDELAEISDNPFSQPMARALVRNAQYVMLARIRGRSRWISAFKRCPVEASLAATQVALLRALDPNSTTGYDAGHLSQALGELPIGLPMAKGPSWERIRDIVLAEWLDAHPLVGILA